MALSGSFYKYPVDNFGLYCTWSATQSVTGNYSDVTLNVYLKYYTLNVGSRSDSTVSINGVSETYTTPAINDSSADYDLTLLKTYTVRVYHNSNGTKTGVALSAYWRFSGTYSGTSIASITASTTIDLDAIDRTAPTVTCSVSNITANSFKISATSSATVDEWSYSLDDGITGNDFSTTAGTTASTTVTGLSANTTYYVRVSARKKSNHVYGETSTVTVKTLGGAIINSCPTITADATTVTFKPNVTVYDASYTKPKVSSISLRRTNDIEAEMQLVFNGSISPITVDGTQKNSLLYVQYRYKLTSATSYGSYTTITSSVTQSGTSFSYSNLELCSLDANSSYDFHVYIRDQLNAMSALSLYFTVPQGTPLVALRKKKVGINTPTPDSAIHVVGNGHFEGDVRIEGTLTPDNIDYDFGI